MGRPTLGPDAAERRRGRVGDAAALVDAATDRVLELAQLGQAVGELDQPGRDLAVGQDRLAQGAAGLERALRQFTWAAVARRFEEALGC